MSWGRVMTPPHVAGNEDRRIVGGLLLDAHATNGTSEVGRTQTSSCLATQYPTIEVSGPIAVADMAGDVPDPDEVGRVIGAASNSSYQAGRAELGGTVACMEGISEMCRIHRASRVCPSVRSPSPRLRAASRATARIKCKMCHARRTL
jgi:hypothetical protein